MDKQKSLLICFPEIAREWNYVRNGIITPDTITYGSGKKVWWICKNGHEWPATVINRTYHNSQCPDCRKMECPLEKSLYIKWPELMKEWDYENNIGLDPKKIRPSDKKISICWKCDKGHKWKTKLSSRITNHNGCPYCSGTRCIEGKDDIVTLYPQLMREWDYNKNKGINPSKLSSGSNVVVWWKCTNGHEWERSIYSRAKRKTMCPYCTENKRSSFIECAYYFYIHNIDESAIHKYMDLGFEIDIFLPDKKTCIEFDGYPWHKNRIRADKSKNINCINMGYRIVRFRHEKLPKLNDGSIEIIYNDNTVESVLKEFIKKEYKIHDVNICFDNDKFKILELYGHEEYENSLEFKCPNISKQWNYEKNGSLKPSAVSYMAHFNVWWKCEKGHEWQATIYGRTYGNYEKCPICSNRRASAGINDLCSMYPELMKEWDYDKNDKDPTKIRPGSKYKAWWKCSSNHSFQQPVKYRTRNNNLCPYCTGQKLSLNQYNLAILYPELMSEWDFDLNDKDPHDYFPSANKKVNWICNKGHKYTALISNRTKKNGTGCPYCAGKKKYDKD